MRGLCVPGVLVERLLRPRADPPDTPSLRPHLLPFCLLPSPRSLNVCYFHGAFETDAAVQLVLEQLSGGQLWDRVTRGSYSERDAARIVRDVVRTIAQARVVCASPPLCSAACRQRSPPSQPFSFLLSPHPINQCKQCHSKNIMMRDIKPQNVRVTCACLLQTPTRSVQRGA